ncbi:hypothetical protein ABPG75_011655 [Micractinium tetrahymenae]
MLTCCAFDTPQHAPYAQQPFLACRLVNPAFRSVIARPPRPPASVLFSWEGPSAMAGFAAPCASRVAAGACQRHGSIAPQPWQHAQRREQAQLSPPAPPAAHGRAPARRVAAAAAEDNADIEVSGAYCMPAFVTADNKRSKCFTVLDVEVGDYPGLLRVISWTLNGLDAVAQNAVVRTSTDGQAYNTFWLTNRSGEKLDDAAAELLAERVRDFVMYCSPDDDDREKTEFCAGPVMLSNSMHPGYTVVMVQEPQPTPGFLLEVASALSGMNVQILQGVVQGGSCDEDENAGLEAQGPLLEQQLDAGSCLLAAGGTGRIFKFCIVDAQGKKLDYGSISALMYTLTSVLGYRTHPTVPPEQEVLMGAR